MVDLFQLILSVVASLFKSRAKLEAEILVLRQQINVLRRQMPKRPQLNNIDRSLWVWLYRWFPPVLAAVCDYQAGDHHSLAPRGISGVLALAVTKPGWPTEDLD